VRFYNRPVLVRRLAGYSAGVSTAAATARKSAAGSRPAAPADSPTATQAGFSTLGQLLESLGLRVLDVVAAPDGLDVAIGETVVHGVGEPIPERPHGILLATGSPTATRDLVADLQSAAEAGYAAAVVKSFGQDVDALAAAAGAAGIALLITPDDMSWRHLDSLLGAASPALGPGADRYSSVGSGDLFSLANAIAAALGGAVTIEDPQGHVLAYSNLPHQEIDDVRRSAILGRQTPDRPTNREEYQAVFAHDGPVAFPSPTPGHAGRTAVGLWAGRRPLGIVWVINDRPPLVPNALELLVDAARVVELQLLRMRGSRDPDRGRRTETLRGVLDGRVDAVSARSDLGLDTVGGCRVLAIGPTSPMPDAPTVPARIVDLVTLFCDGWDPRSLCVAIDETVYALIPVGDGLDRVRRLGTEIAAAARRSADLDLLVAVGPAVTGAAGVPLARAMADRVLVVLRSRGHTSPLPAVAAPADAAGSVAAVEDVQQTVALLTAADRLLPGEDLLLPPVRDLLQADATGGTPYARTLLSFLGSMGDYARTAAELNVHENTVRYRIRRAQDLYGIAFDDPDTLLVTWLQLRLAGIRRTGRP
jgi:hypothetical protein